jgi:hypothetical protein
MKYKAKKSYKELGDNENYMSLGSPIKHNRLLAGEEVEITSLPQGLEEHLSGADKKKKGVKNGRN